MLEGEGVFGEMEVMGGGGLRAKWKDRWPRKDERREDVQESKDWSRDRRKDGEQEGSVHRVFSCQKEKRAQRQERTGGLRMAAEAVPSQGQKTNLPGREIKVQARSAQGAKCAKGKRRRSSPGRWRKLPRSGQEQVEIQVCSKATVCKDIVKGKQKASKKQWKCWGGCVCESVQEGPQEGRWRWTKTWKKRGHRNGSLAKRRGRSI